MNWCMNKNVTKPSVVKCSLQNQYPGLDLIISETEAYNHLQTGLYASPLQSLLSLPKEL
jgi:hypothetical protein